MSTATWHEWKDALYERCYSRFPKDGGMVAQEQLTLRSNHEKRCIDCGAPGSIQKVSVLIKSVPCYYFCDGCEAYWGEK